MSRFGMKKQESAPQSNTGKKYDYQDILDVREVDVTDPQTGKKVSKAKVQFKKGVTISYEGQEINLGDYNSFILQDHEDLARSLDKRAEKGMSEEARQKEEDRINEKRIMYVGRVKVT